MTGIFVPGNKGVVVVVTLIFLSLIIAGSFIITEKKYELKKNEKECELVIKKINDENQEIVKEIEL